MEQYQNISEFAPISLEEKSQKSDPRISVENLNRTNLYEGVLANPSQQNRLKAAIVHDTPEIVYSEHEPTINVEEERNYQKWVQHTSEEERDVRYTDIVKQFAAPIRSEINEQEPKEMFKKFIGNDDVHIRMRQIAKFLVNGEPLDYENFNPHDISSIVLEKYDSPLAFESAVPDILEAIKRFNPQNLSTYTSAINEVGLELYGYQWIYLQQARLAEEQAITNLKVKALREKELQGIPDHEFNYTERAIQYLDKMAEENSIYPSDLAFMTAQAQKGRVKIIEHNGEKEYYFHGKRVIGRDTPINGGVYLIGGKGEALVVDDKEQPLLARTYQNFLKLALQKSRENNNLSLNQFVLKDALEYVQGLMPYSKDGVEIVDKANNIGTDTLAPLELYIKNKVGVCRHQSVLVGYILEKLKEQGYLRGTVSVDRSVNEQKEKGKYSGHAWVRYTASRGEVYIIDPANNVIDTLKNAVQRGVWNYQRPEERQLVVR